MKGHNIVSFFYWGILNMDIQTIMTIMQMGLSFGNICVLGYAFFKFINKPHDTLEERVATIEMDIKDIKRSLDQGNNRFHEQEDTNEVLIRSVFALLEFEVHYCETEQKPISKNLEKAKDDLHEYLAKK